MISAALEKLSRNKWLAGAVGWSLIALFFYIDYRTGDEYRFTILYQLVVVFFAWYCDFWHVLIAVFVCSVLRVFSVYFEGHAYTSIEVPVINSLARFTTFFLTAFIMYHLKKSLREQKETNWNLLRANDEIARLAQAKLEFTSVISHELRTPLTVIKEGVGMVQDGSAGVINPEQKKYLDLAKKNVDRLSRLVNDVLDFQKLSSPQAVLHLAKHDVNKLLLEVKESFAATTKHKGLSLLADLEEGLPELLMDYDKIVQVLTNLIGNAIKATEKGNIRLQSVRAGNAVRISVQDQGSGIKKENLHRLFQPFSQLVSGSERTTGSTGLGLAICKQIIERHHGRIGVESVFGSGSTFYFLLSVEERRNG